MHKKTISNVIPKTGSWESVFVFLVLISLFFYIGWVYLWSVSLRIALFITIYLISSVILIRWKWLLEKISRRGIAFMSVILALLFTGWTILIMVSIYPDNVNIKFNSLYTTTQSFSDLNESERSQATIDYIRENAESLPVNSEQDTLKGSVSDNLVVSLPPNTVGNIALVHVTAVPKPERVYVLVHPHNTQYWYVQTPLTYVETTENKYWEGYVYFGTMDCDCKLKFDLIVLGSKDWYLLDVFRDRGLRAGMKLDYLPTLNQSEVIVVQKHYDGIFDENKCSDLEDLYTTIEGTCPIE